MKKLPSNLAILFFFIRFLSAGENTHISAYYYPWYGEDDRRHWLLGYDGEAENNGPFLGEYSSRDPEIIAKHYVWSRAMGIDNWICSWWGPDSWEDVTLQYRVAPILEQLNRQTKEKAISFCLFYESEGLFGIDPQLGIFFSPDRIKKITDHFHHIAKTYFKHPAYYRIEGRPVVYLYVSRTFSGEYQDALRKVRKTCKAQGFDIYLVGDDVYWGEPDVDRLKNYDAVTPYNMHGPPQPAGTTDWKGFVSKVEGVYRQYHATCQQNGIGFLPGIMPGFDALGTQGGNRYYVIPRTIKPGDKPLSTLQAFTDVAHRFLDSDLRASVVTSFNEWHEGTQLEPGKNGPTPEAIRKILRGSKP